MPKTHTVVLTRAAREAGVPFDELNDAALAATANAKDHHDKNYWRHHRRHHRRHWRRNHLSY